MWILFRSDRGETVSSSLFFHLLRPRVLLLYKELLRTGFPGDRNDCTTRLFG